MVATENSTQRHQRLAQAHRALFGDAPPLRILMAMGLELDEALNRIEQAIAEQQPIDVPEIPPDMDI